MAVSQLKITRITNDDFTVAFHVHDTSKSLLVTATRTLEQPAMVVKQANSQVVLIQAENVSVLIYHIDDMSTTGHEPVLLWASVEHPALDAYRAKGE